MTYRAIVVHEPGILTTIQDLGRPGFGRFGVSHGGALDRAALILGNRLVGNDPGEAGLEMTLIGPRLRFDAPAIVALTGADLDARRNGTPMPRWQPVAMQPGDEIAFAPGGTGRGARAYLCVAGGFALDPVMGSRSTDLFGGFGGLDGRPLRAGDELPMRGTRTPLDACLPRRLTMSPPDYDVPVAARVVLGPQANRFTETGLRTFLDSTYTVSQKADRMALRLTGPPLEHARGADLISEGIAVGAIQVPGDGQPIVLLPACQTIGGYVKIATVIGADLDRLSQLRPGNDITFAAVEPVEARKLTLDYWAALGEDAITSEPPTYPGWRSQHEDKEEQSVAHGWDPAGVRLIMEAMTAAGVTEFRLDIASAGFTLEIHRGPDTVPRHESPVPARPTAEPPPQPSPVDTADLIVAPLLGVFYRRPEPTAPPFAEPGQPVAAGQPIGLIEVMKTYNEVTAPRAGILAEFVVDDGQSVEYGQAIARLEAVETSQHG